MEDLSNETAVCLGLRRVCLNHSAQNRGDLSVKVSCGFNEWIHDLAELVLYDTEAGRDEFFRIDLENPPPSSHSFSQRGGAPAWGADRWTESKCSTPWLICSPLLWLDI